MAIDKPPFSSSIIPVLFDSHTGISCDFDDIVNPTRFILLHEIKPTKDLQETVLSRAAVIHPNS